ncbi:Short-chain alcohol dehydrogenase [Halanaeroarchaeum sp. HSR-CO]|uniref:SDR family NAD(P)-dependent oxidoreductase n=1 Tax=Halanaeroarchaeum sp. HSR-CO TaxID=2866382 RepID=UPI00217D2000|nr:SDR family oxidoreductase [Halanaeroarchaeum sp. HSR-CO]UWG46341.1 Short-chain alcohol dehydrogenase [Halanaeroarchaeum sp. HSR-CO]
MDYGLEGNAGLVLASSRGLGKASATALANEGVNVVVNGRDEDTLATTVAELRETARGDVVGVTGDITDLAAIETLVETTVAEFGGIDHLVTSAGGPPRQGFESVTDEEWYAAYDLLVMSVVRSIRASLPHLRESSGTIVNITSRRTKEATPSNVLSSSVRMAIPGLMKALSRDLAPEIRINTVRPGPFKTSRNDPESWERKRQPVPLDRVGEPGEFGDVVAFLCSERSSFVTGASIPVDGGASHATL